MLYRVAIANGAAVSSNPPRPGTGVGAVLSTVDPRNSIVTSTTQEQLVRSSDPEFPMWQDCGPRTHTDNYDAASRLISKVTTMSVNTSIADCANAYDSGPYTDWQYGYDAEDHHTVVGEGSGVVNGTLKWSPTGHAYAMPYNGQNYSVHYDGDRVLFITDASGALWLAKIETLANYSAGSLQIVDRDVSGKYASKHNGAFYGGVSLGSTLYKNKDQPAVSIPQIFWGSTNDPLCGPRTGSTAATCAPAGNFEYDRLEGFEYFGLTMQGARAVDESTGKWTTPDAYAGDVHDPLSQKPFMWDRNNAYAYSDPSGFQPHELVAPDWGRYSPFESIDAAEARQRQPIFIGSLFGTQDWGNIPEPFSVQNPKSQREALAALKYAAQMGDFDEHHGVMRRSKYTLVAREVARRAGASLEDALNKSLVPRWFHQRLHTEAYGRWVNRFFRGDETKAEVQDAFKRIQEGIRDAILSGKRPEGTPW
jgi:hypothetical protein